jgi:hypothetical protein
MPGRKGDAILSYGPGEKVFGLCGPNAWYPAFVAKVLYYNYPLNTPDHEASLYMYM